MTLQSKGMANITRIANAVPVTLYSRVTVNADIVILNCQKCNQCLKCQVSGQESQEPLFVGVIVIVFSENLNIF